jgi:D-alanine transaminase
MPRYAYVNGRYVAHGEAAVHIEDRGFQFADGVYEVVTVHAGKLVDEEGHLRRLDRSLRELQMPWPMSERALRLVMRQLIAKNGIGDGIVYLQITRGQAPRDFKYPKGVSPTLVMTTRFMNLDPVEQLNHGVKVITIPDIRWKRRDIKSVALLPQAMGKQKAAEAGAFEAWQVDDEGFITEGCSSNAWIVTDEGVLVTRHASNDILNGITRQSLIRLAESAGIPFEERAFSVAEAHAAREAFLSSATTYVTPITQIDEHKVGEGVPGALAGKLREAYLSYARSEGAS